MNLKYFFAITSLLFTCDNYSLNSLIGKPAPLFASKAVFPDGTIKAFDLKNYLGQKIVLYFYPMDNTPGCTIQAKKFRDEIARLQAADILVVGISCDSIKSHLNFQKKHALPYILVSDSRWTRAISKLYHASSFFMSKRKTFLINKEGILFEVFEHVDIQNQIDAILASFATQPE